MSAYALMQKLQKLLMQVAHKADVGMQVSKYAYSTDCNVQKHITIKPDVSAWHFEEGCHLHMTQARADLKDR